MHAVDLVVDGDLARAIGVDVDRDREGIGGGGAAEGVGAHVRERFLRVWVCDGELGVGGCLFVLHGYAHQLEVGVFVLGFLVAFGIGRRGSQRGAEESGKGDYFGELHGGRDG